MANQNDHLYAVIQNSLGRAETAAALLRRGGDPALQRQLNNVLRSLASAGMGKHLT